MSAFGWIGELAHWLAEWMPHLLHVPKGQRAIKFIRGRTEEKGPGLHWYWPVTTTPSAYPVVRQVLSLPTQTLTTKDGRTVIAGAVVVYSIANLTAFMVENYDAEDSVGELSEAGVRKAVTERTFKQLQDAQADVDSRLSARTQRLLAPLGVEVEYVRLTDFAPSSVVSLQGEVARGGEES